MAIVILPDGNFKQSKQILKNIVICQDGSQYYWNSFSENIIFASYSVNSVPPFILPESNCGIVESISYSLSGVDYENTLSGEITPIGGAGQGLRLKLTSKNYSKYILNNFSIYNNGIDYKVGDIVYSDILGSLTVTSTTSIQKNKINDFSVSLKNRLYDTQPQSIISIEGPNTTASTLAVSCAQHNMYEISSITISNPGSDYESGDTITIPNLCSFTVDVDYGNKGILNYKIDNLSTISYMKLPDNTSNIPSKNKTGSGSGATFSTSYSNRYEIQKCELTNKGTGYSVGDKFTFSADIGKDPYVTIIVTGVSSGSGTILVFEPPKTACIVNNEIKNYLISATGGTGAGASFYINSSSSIVYEVDTTTISNYGSGYAVGDTLIVSPTLRYKVSELYDIGEVLDFTQTITSNISEIIPPKGNIATTGGKGKGYTCSIMYQSSYNYIINSISIQSSKNFSANDVINFEYGTINVTDVYTGGEVLKYSVNLKNTRFYGSVPTSFPKNPMVGREYTWVSNSENGLSFNFDVVPNDPTETMYIPNITIVSGGNCYSTADIIYVYGSNQTLIGSLTNIQVDGNGALTDFDYTPLSVGEKDILTFSHPMYVNMPTNVGLKYLIMGSSAVTATFSYTFTETTDYYTIDGFNMTNPGVGYSVGASFDIEIYGIVTVNSVAATGQIKDFTYTNTSKPSTTHPDDSISYTDRTKTATITTSYSYDLRYNVMNFLTSSNGSGYEIGDILSVGTYGTLTVTNVSKTGQIKTVDNLNVSNFYEEDIAATNIPTTTTGSGTGAALAITTKQSSKNVISSYNMNCAGYGYTAGDILSLGDYGDITISKVDEGDKYITSYDVSYSAKYYSSDIANNPHVIEKTTNGSGAVFNFTTTQEYVCSSLNIVNRGFGYNTGDVLEVAGDYYSDGNYYSDGGIVKITGVEKNSQPVKSISMTSNNIINDTSITSYNCSGGSGSGLVVSIEYKPIVAYEITDIKLLNSGNFYNVGDVLDLNGYGTLTVNSIIDSGGSIIDLKQNIKTIDSDKNLDYSGIDSLKGGSGSGATISIKYDKYDYYRLSNIEIEDGGYGYDINDFVMIDTFQGVSITSIKNNI